MIDVSEKPFLEDIQYTLDLVLDKSIKDISDNFLDKLSNIDIDFSKYRKSNNRVQDSLSNVLSIDNKNDLDKKYFNFFSPNTQQFIIDNLSNGAKWKLRLTIDDTTRISESSNKNFTVTVSWLCCDDHIIDHDNNKYNRLETIKSICEELSKYHYLWLWIEWWVLESIEIDRPKYSNVSEIDKTTWKKKINKLKNREIITYPLPRIIKKEEINIKRNRKMKK